jgi:predicted GH43/DUF377 family glycosyl hydrolase
MNSIKWDKMGRLFDPSQIQGKYFLKSFAQAPATLVFDDFVRIYFTCRPDPDENGQYVSYCAFVDVERTHLLNIKRFSEKPIMELGGLGTFDEFGTNPVSVIRKGEEIWAYYAGWTRSVSVPFNVAIGLAISNDNGETFKKVGPGPVLSYSPDEPFIIGGPKIRYFNNKYYLFYIAGEKWVLDNGKPEPVYNIRMATSDDGINWVKHNKNLVEKKIADNEAQASPDVFYSDGFYHMFFCYRSILDYRNSKGGYRIGYARSKNLTDWERDDYKAGLTVSDSGWDEEMVSLPHVFSVDNQIYMAYMGNYFGRSGFGLARLDGTSF